MTSTVTEAIQAPPSDPDVYVLNAEAELRQFPSTYLAVCEIDPLRDDGLIINDTLKTAGYIISYPSAHLRMFFRSNLAACRVSVKLDYYKGLPHVFWAFGCPAPSGDFVADVVAGIKIFTHT